MTLRLYSDLSVFRKSHRCYEDLQATLGARITGLAECLPSDEMNRAYAALYLIAGVHERAEFITHYQPNFLTYSSHGKKGYSVMAEWSIKKAMYCVVRVRLQLEI